MSYKHTPKIVVIGGGTGSFTILSALKKHTDQITALVAMFDNGGSTGQLRDEYGVLPPGDIRQCLVALSNAPKLRDLFNFRFGEGSFDGHSFGNLFLSAVEKLTDDFGAAVDLAGKTLNITGRVMPITLESTQMVLTDGITEVVGEHNIENAVLRSRDKPRVELRPKVGINPAARAAILEADLIVLAPGSLYESLISNFLVDGVVEALAETKARVVAVVNLVTKPGQTDGWTVADYVTEMERFAGAGSIDYVLYNTKQPTQAMLDQYASSGEFPVEARPEQFVGKAYQAIGKELLHIHHATPDPNDKLGLERTLIRHDAKVAQAIMDIATL